jgi:hypothetical protein
LALSLITAIWIAGETYFGMKEIRGEILETQKMLTPLPSGSRLYPINFDPRGPAVNYASFMHLWAVYGNEKIVFSPYLFTYFDLMPLSQIQKTSPTFFPSTREDLPELIANGEICERSDLLDTTDCASIKNSAFQNILKNSSFYDYWFIYSPPPEFLNILNAMPGLKKVSEYKKATLWHNEAAKPFEPALF